MAKLTDLVGVYKVLNEYTRRGVPMVQISILRETGVTTETHHLRKADLINIRREVVEIGPKPSDEDEITRELTALWCGARQD